MSASTIELHTHTYFSDGKSSPSELLHYAASVGLRILAITDHDNTNGVREALALAQELGLELIPAIEFTCRWPQCEPLPGDGDVDVLGYFVDLEDPEFRAFEQASLEDVHLRTADCCASLTAAGYPVTLQEVFAENPRYAGVLQMIMAVNKKGYAEDWGASFKMVSDQWAQVRLSQFTVQEVIQAIHMAGGVAVLAHPVMVKCNGNRLQEKELLQLKEMGLDGLEIFHPRLDEEARSYFSTLARRLDLLVSGGSDEHGWLTELKNVGSQPVTPELVEGLCRRHQVWDNPSTL